MISPAGTSQTLLCGFSFISFPLVLVRIPAFQIQLSGRFPVLPLGQNSAHSDVQPSSLPLVGQLFPAPGAIVDLHTGSNITIFIIMDNNSIRIPLGTIINQVVRADGCAPALWAFVADFPLHPFAAMPLHGFPLFLHKTTSLPIFIFFALKSSTWQKSALSHSA